MIACGLDFGTSNSAIGVAHGKTAALAPVEADSTLMPSAVFFDYETRGRVLFGNEAISAHVGQTEGRLMRALKSILGSPLIDEETGLAGRKVPLTEVVEIFVRHLKRKAEAFAGQEITAVVHGRPVRFVDDDDRADARAQQMLEAIAGRVGFRDVAFVYEPIAAAHHYEQTVQSEELVLVADIGGGTSDFSVVRVGPERKSKIDRKEDILANHGVHIAGTDFDRRIELASILPELGYGALGPSAPGAPAREVPSAVYFDLATWHLINTVYNPQRVAELRQMRAFYAEPRHHARLLRVLAERLGHDLLARAEAAKIEVAEGGVTCIDLDRIESGLAVSVRHETAHQALDADADRIVDVARETVRQAGLPATAIEALYFTGGSTGLRLLTDRLAGAFPAATVVRGDRFASVATGLGLHARRLHGAPKRKA